MVLSQRKNIKKFNATQENSFALIPKHQNRLKVKHEKCDAVSKAVIVSNGVELVKARKQQIGNQGNQKHACIGGEKLEYSKPSWQRWWWYKKSINVSGKWKSRPSSVVYSVSKRQGGNSKKRSSRLEEHPIYIKHEGKIYRFINISSAGWCFYESLSFDARGRKIKSGETVRNYLAKATDKRSQETRAAVHTLLARRNCWMGLEYDERTIERIINKYHKKVASKVMSLDTWGDEVDALIYSYLTGERVKILQNQVNGIVCIHDTLCELGLLRQLSTENALNETVTDRSETHVVYYHPVGKAIGDPCHKEYVRDHYCVLVEKNGNEMVFEPGSCVFEGGCCQTWLPIAQELRRSKRREVARERKAKSRGLMTKQQHQMEQTQNRKRNQQARESESVVKTKQGRYQDAVRHQDARAAEAVAETLERQSKDAARHQNERASEGMAEILEKQTKDSLRHQQTRASEAMAETVERQSKDSVRHRGKRASEALGERLERQTKDAMRHQEKRIFETDDVRSERQKVDAKTHRLSWSAKQAEIMKQIQINDINISAEELKQKMKLHQELLARGECKAKIPFFQDANCSLPKALLQFYLNSGCLRFQQYREYDEGSNGKYLEFQQLLEEIDDAMLSDEEIISIIQRFLQAHSYTDCKLFSCGACGKREYESDDTPFTRFEIGSSTSPLGVLKFSREDEEELVETIADPANTIQVPTDMEWQHMKTIEVWKAKSFWEEQHADGSKTYWHLHPELVEEDVKKKGHSTLLCIRCAESIKKQKIP